VPGAVDVGVVAGGGLVLDVGDGDGDAALALLGGVVDRVEGAVLRLALEREVLRDGSGETRLAVVFAIVAWSTPSVGGPGRA